MASSHSDNSRKSDVTPNNEKYVLSLDIGSSSLRSHIYDRQCHIKGTSQKQIDVLHPEPGRSELDPENLFNNAVDCIKESIQASGIPASQITCMGISTLRNTFITWNRTTGRPYHNFISWLDLRARDYVAKWNQSYMLKFLQYGAKLLYLFTRSKRYMAASVIKYMSSTIPMRLLWVLDNIDKVRSDANEGNVLFGTVDTWLLWKFTKGKTFATDYSCASMTLLFDPYTMEWSSMSCGFVNIPMSILPEVKDTSGDFGACDPQFFGVPIPITAVIADSQSAMFGQCCFHVGDVKCTMGSGMFLDLNTGSSPHASMTGLYPVVGWKIGKELVYLAEGICADAGTLVDWAKNMGLCDDVTETAALAQSVPDNGGVYFVPAFSGLQTPINDDDAATGFVGMTVNTRKPHAIRAILESVVFRFKLLFDTLLMETNVLPVHVRVDGGMSRNDFMLQLIADLTNHPIARSDDTELTSLGAAFLAGLHAGVWSSKEELEKLWKCGRVFEPNLSKWSEYHDVVSEWERAVKRLGNWYKS